MTVSHTDEHPLDGGKSAFGKLSVLMVTAFIDMLGMLMILPLLPFYAKDLGAGGLVVGLLVSSFSVAQLLSAPLWGRFSDKHGRRPALIVGLASSAIAYVVFAYADSLWLLLLSRIVQGAGGGTVSVIQAYVADATRPEVPSIGSSTQMMALPLVSSPPSSPRMPSSGNASRIFARRKFSVARSAMLTSSCVPLDSTTSWSRFLK